MKASRILILTFLITSFSCSNDTVIVDETNLKENSQQLRLAGGPIGHIYSIVKTLSALTSIVKGKAYEHIEWYENGQVKSSKRGCRGFLGDCVLPSMRMSNGSSMSVKEPGLPDIYDNSSLLEVEIDIHKINNFIILAFDDKKANNIGKNFFKENFFDLDSKYMIDNPNVLNELGLSQAISIHGRYEVFQNNDFKYIVIHEF